MRRKERNDQRENREKEESICQLEAKQTKKNIGRQKDR